ncbi:MAG: MFS transporter [Bdellovibrionota bacterium]
MQALWNNKTFRKLFLAGLLSEFGTFVSEVAIMMRIFELAHGQIRYLGITQGIFLLSMILGTILGGVFGERGSKKKILLLCELARIPVIGLMLFGTNSIWILIAGNGVIAFFSGAFNPTRQALINETVPRELLPKANSIFSTTFALLHAAGPLASGLLFSFLGKISPILLFDLATYFVGISFLLRIPAHVAKENAPEPNFIAELLEGMGQVKTMPAFFWLLLRSAVASAALGLVLPLLLPMATEVLRLPAYSYGFLICAFGSGGALGGLILPKLLQRFSLETQVKSLFFAECFALLVWASLAVPVLSFVLAFIYGATIFGRIAGQLNFISALLPPTLNSRANALVDLSMVVPNVLGSLVLVIAGPSIDTFSFLHYTGVVLCLLALILNLLERLFHR